MQNKVAQNLQREVIDGSNESFKHPNENFHPDAQKGSPLQKSFGKDDVKAVYF